jgi:hypothetical protein
MGGFVDAIEINQALTPNKPTAIINETDDSRPA